MKSNKGLLRRLLSSLVGSGDEKEARRLTADIKKAEKKQCKRYKNG